MDTDIEIGSGFTLRLPDQIVYEARRLGISTIVFPTDGVSWYRRTHSWRAYIYCEGKQKHLGYFKDKSTAIAVRQAAERETVSS